MGALYQYINIPLGIAEFPKAIANVPPSWCKTMGPIVIAKTFGKGGHFAAWERPHELVGHLYKMFGDGGPAANVT